ncbi:hypothetical protein ABW54_08660 [Burkholderia cenocepacia]|nr:hypothetical protein ABW54_08660 [Burkholderia cenocepacia]
MPGFTVDFPAPERNAIASMGATQGSLARANDRFAVGIQRPRFQSDRAFLSLRMSEQEPSLIIVLSRK